MAPRVGLGLGSRPIEAQAATGAAGSAVPFTRLQPEPESPTDVSTRDQTAYPRARKDGLWTVTEHGFIKLPRAIRQHRRLWDRHASPLQAWIDLLMMASYQAETVPAKDGGSVKLRRGEVLVSYGDLEKRWGWSRDQVRYFIQQRREDGELEKVKDLSRGGTIWRFPQSESTADSHSGAAGNSHSESQRAQRVSGESPHSSDGADSHSTPTVSPTVSPTVNSHSESVGGEGLPADPSHGGTPQSVPQSVPHKKLGGKEGKEGKETPTQTRPRSVVAVVVDELVRTEQRWGLPQSSPDDLETLATWLTTTAAAAPADLNVPEWVRSQESGSAPHSLGVLKWRLRKHLEPDRRNGGDAPADSPANAGSNSAVSGKPRAATDGECSECRAGLPAVDMRSRGGDGRCSRCRTAAAGSNGPRQCSTCTSNLEASDPDGGQCYSCRRVGAVPSKAAQRT